MATAVQPAMTMSHPMGNSNQCFDPDNTDAFFDFSQMPSPSPSTARHLSNATSLIASPSNTALDEDLQTPAKPSHEYERFKQQTGLPSGSIAGINPSHANQGFSFSSTGLDEASLMDDASFGINGAWNSGIGMDMDIMSQPPAFFFPNSQPALSDDFVDPSAITQQEVQNVRVWPGMHQQQAALAKAQAQAQHQRQQQLMQQRQQQQAQQQQQQQQQQQAQQSQQPQKRSHNRNNSSPLSDAQTEETIARVVNQIRQQSQNSALAAQEAQGNMLPHIIRAKKDEEDMDEDERLLASEEGKKLSSKERRQLRNKVSARAFRSRRKGKKIPLFTQMPPSLTSYRIHRPT
jgi:chemotaxis protein histidine kinase CheA